MTEPESQRSFPLWLIPIVLALLVFGRAASFEFVNFDDDKLIYANGNILAPTLDGLRYHWTHVHSHFFIPVVYTAWWLLGHVALVQNGQQFVLNPWIFHGANIVFHLINVWLVWKILQRLIADEWAVLLGTVLFAIHPLQAEPVGWATGLKDVLSSTFALSSIVLGLIAHDATRRQLPWWIACFAAQILAALCKPSTIVTPFIIVAILWALDERRSTRVIIALIGFVLAIPIIFITKKAQPALDLPITPLWTRPLIASDALAFYISKLVAPINLTIDQGRSPTRVIQTGAIYWTWLVPAVCASLVVISRKKLVQLGAIIFVIALLPTLGLTRFQFQIFSTVSDRYAYLSLLGASIVLAGLVDWRPKLQWPARVALGLFAILALVQIGTWRNSESLWTHAIRVNDRSALAFHNLGQVRLAQGDISKSIELFKRAAELDPNDAFSWLSLARAQMNQGLTKEAAESIEKYIDVFSARSDFNANAAVELLGWFEIRCKIAGDFESAERLKARAQKIMAEASSGR